MLNKEKETDVMKEIIATTAEMGMTLSNDGMKALEKAIISVNKYMCTVTEKVAAGMSKEEAVAWYFGQMSAAEQSEFMAEINIVDKYEKAKINFYTNR